ncbi:MAG: hypothetical protein U0L27_04590 [Ruminococcus sp.]|nr:hypothetical protein [Ruminococcus sp.]
MPKQKGAGSKVKTSRHPSQDENVLIFNYTNSVKQRVLLFLNLLAKVKWTYPLISTSFPLAYSGFVLIHAAILGFDTSIVNSIGIGPLIYPYFFLNPEKVGYGGIAMWVGILLTAFIVIGYLFFGIDKLLCKRKID